MSKEFPDHPHGEIHFAADSKNSKRIFGGSMVWFAEANTFGVVVYASTDGGKTWRPTLKFDEGSDPAAGYSPDGTAVFLKITHTAQTPQASMKIYTEVHRSKDGGSQWLPPSVHPLYDRHFVITDSSGGKYHGRLYIPGLTGSMPGIDGVRSPGMIGVLRSKDGGEAFDPPIYLSSTPGHRLNGLAPGVVLSDGTLMIPFAELKPNVNSEDLEGSPLVPNAILKVLRSEDGGDTFSSSVIGDIAFGNSILGTPYHFGFGVDRSDGPFRDRLYAVAADTKLRSANIILSYSRDKGKTWSKYTVVNDDRPRLNPDDGPVHFAPVVAVNRDGVVGVRWGDRRDSTNGVDWTTRFAASLDGGETFLPSVAVSESPFRHQKGDNFAFRASASGGGHFSSYNAAFGGGPLEFSLSISQFYLAGGHTASIVADADGVFHPFWVDNRTGVAQLWTAPVTVEGKAVRNGSPDLSSLEEITERVILEYGWPQFDQKTGRVTVEAKLYNVSKETLRAPIKVRVTGLTSAAGGIARILGADNGESGPGAIWDFSPLLSERELKPDGKSAAKRLEFSVTDLPPLPEALKYKTLDTLGDRVRRWGALEVVRVRTRVFASGATRTSISESP